MSDINSPVSSANRDVKKSVAFGKSFINKRNRRGPNTLCFIQVEFTFTKGAEQQKRKLTGKQTGQMI